MTLTDDVTAARCSEWIIDQTYRGEIRVSAYDWFCVRFGQAFESRSVSKDWLRRFAPENLQLGDRYE